MKPEQSLYNTDIDDVVFLNMTKRRYEEASGHWQEKYSLKHVRAENNNLYTAKYVEEKLVDERYEEVSVDNRQFTAVRTILPFLTARLTSPEVTPANGEDISIQFAEDFSEALERHAAKQMARGKVRLSIQDLLRGERVGIGMWRYDAMLNTIIYEHIAPESVVIGKRSKLFEEPDFIRRTIERSVGDLCQMFPDKKDKIFQLFSIEKGTPSQLEKVYKINEDWIWVDVKDKKQLLVGWSYQNFLFGKVDDPNWNKSGKNLIDRPMMPFVFFNFLNDGSTLIDQTSFMEQAKWLQKNINKRGQTIAENARYGGTGVPIFAKGSISQKDVAKIHFSPIQRVLLDTADVGKSFTTWNSQNLPNYIVEDKIDLRTSHDNIWASNSVLRGQSSDNKTATQDVLNRNQAEGRLSDPVDCIDDSMTRFYQLEGQLMYRFFDEKKFYNYIGDNGKFVSVVISQEAIAKNFGIEIAVKAGTSLPIDRAQKRATVMQLLQLNKVSTLDAYKELGIFEDPEAAFKNYMLEMTAPQELISEVDKQVFDREASEDLITVIGGKIPKEREDLSDEYVNYLNEYLLTDKYKLLREENADAATRVSQYIDAVIAKMSRKADKLAMQPNPEAGAGGGQPQQVPPEVAAMMSGGQPGATPPQSAAPPVTSAMPSAGVQLAQ